MLLAIRQLTIHHTPDEDEDEDDSDSEDDGQQNWQRGARGQGQGNARVNGQISQGNGSQGNGNLRVNTQNGAAPMRRVSITSTAGQGSGQGLLGILDKAN
jgi:hypothetical protein